MRWNYYNLDAVARLVSGRTPEREQREYYAESGTPWVKIENLNQGFITEAAEYLSEKGREKVNLVPKNSVLFSIVGTVGKVGIAGRELATNQQIVSLIFDESKVLPLFGYYCLRYHADEIRKLSNQTTMALISRKTLGQYRIYVPESLEEQEKIVEKLQKFEAYGKKKEELRESFHTYENVLFRKIFHGEIQYHEKSRLREFLQESVISGVPKNEEPSEKNLLISSEAFVRSYMIEEEKDSLQQEEPCSMPNEKYRIQEGDILLRNGCLILAQQQKTDKFIDRSVLRIRTKSAQLLPEVLYAYLNLEDIKQTLYAERKAGDSRKRPIRGSELERMEIPYFTMEKQKEYAACLKKIRRIQKALDREIAYAWRAFRVIAYRLLSGVEEEKQQAAECPIAENQMPERSAMQYEVQSIKNARPESEMSEERAGDEFQSGNMQENAGTEVQDTRPGKETVSHLVLAVLSGWCPQDDTTGEYCRKRQEIFRMAQPIFQPVALSLVTSQGQKEYLLERDFLTYHSRTLCNTWEQPLTFFRKLLEQQERGEILDAHLAFQGEDGIATEADWDSRIVDSMAREGLILIASYSGFAACEFLFR